MAHSARRSQKRRIAHIRAENVGLAWRTNREQANVLTFNEPARVKARRFALVPESSYVAPDVQVLDTAISKSADKAGVAGRLALKRSQRSISVRDMSDTYKVVS